MNEEIMNLRVRNAAFEKEIELKAKLAANELSDYQYKIMLKDL